MEIKTYQEGECYVIEAPRDPNNLAELKVYNPDYFRDLGYANAEISIVGGEVEVAGKIIGGYYENPSELSWPFREFVYVYQGESVAKNEESSRYPENPGPSIYEQAFGNRSASESMFNKLMEKVSSYFSANKSPEIPPEESTQIPPPPPEESTQIPPPPPEESTQIPPPPSEESTQIPPPPPEESTQIPPPPPEESTQIPPPPSEESTQIPPPPPPSPSPSPSPSPPPEESTQLTLNTTKWLVRLCVEPAEESRESQLLRAYRANKMRGIIMENPTILKLWKREIQLGTVSVGESKLEISGEEGSEGNKWSRL